MCGILGTINKYFTTATLDLLKHRGPDGFGIDAFVVNHHNIQLGHRRLAIQDVSSAGHQPMISTCKGYAIVFNGEIYNHLDLRKKLPQDIQYNGHSDTETILHYMIHFGVHSISDFNGIFSFAFLDINKETITLARDPFGVKPLYYYQDNNTFVFASEIRPIQDLVQANKVDMQGLASALRLRYNPAPNTVHQHIKKMIPGHMYTVAFNDAVLKSENKSYVIHKLAKAPEEVMQDHVMNYGEALEQAVKRQLLADVEVGILLSGGVDSALVAALAKKYYKGTLKAFTIGFEGDFDEDEIADAKETAELLGLEHHVKKITFSDFLGLIKECSRIVEEPLATTSMIPMYYLAKLAATHVKVVLTGQGADEPLGGYTRYTGEVLREKLPQVLRPILKPMVSWLGLKNETILRGANAIGIKNDIERFLLVYEIFSEKEIAQLIGCQDTESKAAITDMFKLLQFDKNQHPAEKMMALDTRMNLADDLLNYTDKITMHCSLECRVPMLDTALVRFIENLPLSQRVNLKGGKIIHKQFAKTVLPKRIVNRKKKGFQSPTNTWFRTEMQTVKDILLQKETKFSQLVNQEHVAVILDLHNQGYNKEKQIFLLLSIFYWLEAVNETSVV